MEFIDLNAQQQRVKSKIDNAISNVLSHGKYILGPEVYSLEESLAEYVGVKHCISCANGSDAIQVALLALDIGPGDEVIVPCFSYIATASMVSLVGAKPVFVDIDPRTYNLNPNLIEDAITDRTKAIIAVSLYGQCANFCEINKVAEKHNLAVIEDGAQSFGATFKGQKSCSFTTIATTSFFPSKPLGCYGDGGAIFTNDDYLADKISQLARHGQSKRYYHARLGLNSRLDTIQAAILLVKLGILDDETAARQNIANSYSEGLEGTNFVTPYITKYNISAWAQYTVRVPNRSTVQELLKKDGIPTAVHYPLPLNFQPAVRDETITAMHSKKASDEVMSLPMHPYLSNEQLSKIIVCLNKVFAAL